MAIFGKKENKEEKKEETKVSAPISKEDTGDAYRVLVRPLVSEKAFSQANAGKYVFKINTSANKIMVKKAVEKVYDVKVVDVNIITVKGKTRNFGRLSGRTQDWKKAVVTLKKGQSIGAQS